MNSDGQMRSAAVVIQTFAEYTVHIETPVPVNQYNDRWVWAPPRDLRLIKY